jgi:hypothetical protein
MTEFKKSVIVCHLHDVNAFWGCHVCSHASTRELGDGFKWHFVCGTLSHLRLPCTSF